jgi:hypothetical protein
MDRRQAFIEQAVRTIIAAGVRAVHSDDFEACLRSLEEAVSVYESNPSCVHTPRSHFFSLILFVDAAQSVSEELGRSTSTVRELRARLSALQQTIH